MIRSVARPERWTSLCCRTPLPGDGALPPQRSSSCQHASDAYSRHCRGAVIRRPIPDALGRLHTICKATPGQIGGQDTLVVDAETLYEGLGVNEGTPFRNWVKRRVLDNPEFEAGKDYEDNRSELNGLGGRGKALVVLLTLESTPKLAAMLHDEQARVTRPDGTWPRSAIWSGPTRMLRGGPLAGTPLSSDDGLCRLWLCPRAHDGRACRVAGSSAPALA
jgi:phage anti-repressor protein